MTALTIPLTIDLTLGAANIGTLVATLLFGMFLIQVYTYALSCTSDRPWLKFLIAVAGFLETMHMILTWTYIYNLNVRHFGNPFEQLELPWFQDLDFAIQGTVVVIIQAFFTHRAYALSGKIWVAAPAFIAELFSWGVDIAGAIISGRIGNIPDFRVHSNFVFEMAFITAAVIDVWNAVALCYCLRSRAKRSSFPNTIRMLNGIALYTIETGLITSAVAIAAAICWGLNGIGLTGGLMIIHPTLIANSLLVSLNAREGRRQTTTGSKYSSAPVSSLPHGPGLRLEIMDSSHGTSSVQALPLTFKTDVNV